MKKVFSFLLLMVCLLTVSSQAFAGNESSIKEGVYKGSLTEVYMNGNKDPYGPIEAELTVNADGTINIFIDSFQIGNMPGSIKINAQKITCTGENFNQDCNNAITLKMPVLSAKNFKANVTGYQTGNNLHFTVTSIGATYLGISFSAKVTFDGTWNREIE